MNAGRFCVLALVLCAGAAISPAVHAADKFKPFVVSEVKPKRLPAVLKKIVKEGVTLGALVKTLGPGWVSKGEGTGYIRWVFMDGSMLSVLPAGSDAKTTLTFGEGNAEKGQMRWERAKDLGL